MKTESSSSFSSSVTTSRNEAATSAGNNNSSGGVALSSRVPLTLRDYFFQDPFFKNAWEDFDRIQQEMARQSREFWTRVRQDNLALMQDSNVEDGSSNNKDIIGKDDFFKAGEGEMAAPFLFPRRWMLPRFLSRDESDRLFPSEFFDLKKEEQVLSVKEDDSKFELSLDTHDYRPDEIKVNVQGGALSVEARHEEKGDGRFVSRQFSRKYTLPQGCEPHRVVSNLSSDGVLMITAPKRKALKEEAGARAVPIEMKK